MKSNNHIERAAIQVRKRIWRDRYDIWPGQMHEPRLVLDPELAALVLGIQFEYQDDLGEVGGERNPQRVAGHFYSEERRIVVSQAFGHVAQRFTGAHEVGHSVLHSGNPNMTLHRDRPIYGLERENRTRTTVEREADRFAAAFLVPPNFLHKQLEIRFGLVPFVFDENAAFWLNPSDPRQLVQTAADPLDRARAVARSTHFGNEYFTSLKDYFEVSTDTMAIRLHELGLVRDPAR